MRFSSGAHIRRFWRCACGSRVGLSSTFAIFGGAERLGFLGFSMRHMVFATPAVSGGRAPKLRIARFSGIFFNSPSEKWQKSNLEPIRISRRVGACTHAASTTRPETWGRYPCFLLSEWAVDFRGHPSMSKSLPESEAGRLRHSSLGCGGWILKRISSSRLFGVVARDAPDYDIRPGPIRRPRRPEGARVSTTGSGIWIRCR